MSHKIAKDVAEQEFNRFADCMDLDLNPKDMSDEDRANFQEQKRKIVSAIESGSLTINEQGEPTFIPQRTQDAKPITFYEPTGASLMAMDRRKKNEDVGRMYEIMGAMTQTPMATFSTMKMADLKICQAITALFLG